MLLLSETGFGGGLDDQKMYLKYMETDKKDN